MLCEDYKEILAISILNESGILNRFFAVEFHPVKVNVIIVWLKRKEFDWPSVTIEDGHPSMLMA